MAFAGLYGTLGYFNHVRGNIKKAEEYYQKGYERGMRNVKRLAPYGVIKLRKGEFEEAIKIFDMAMRQKPQGELKFSIRASRALAYFKTGQYDRAVAALEDLHENHRCTRVYQSLGYVYIYGDDMEKALAYNLEALDYVEDDPVVMDNLGQLYEKLGDMEKAAEFYAKAYEESETHADINYHMGCMAERNGDEQKALGYFIQASGCKMSALNDVSRQQIMDKIEALQAKGLVAE